MIKKKALKVNNLKLNPATIRNKSLNLKRKANNPLQKNHKVRVRLVKEKKQGKK